MAPFLHLLVSVSHFLVLTFSMTRVLQGGELWLRHLRGRALRSGSRIGERGVLSLTGALAHFWKLRSLPVKIPSILRWFS